MTTVRQMFALQELDIVLDRVQDEHDRVENELNNGDTVKNLETELERTPSCSRRPNYSRKQPS